MNSSRLDSAIRIVDKIFWYTFLAMLFYLSFATDRYASAHWMWFSAALYLFSAAYFSSLLMGGRANYKAMITAKVFIVIWLCVLIIHALQLVLPIQTPIHKLFSPNAANAPEWYQPDLVLSLVPHQTQWVLMRELIVLMIFILSLFLIDSRRRIKQLLFLLLLVGASHAVIAILAKFGNVYLVNVAALDGHNTPARGVFVNRNHLSAFVGLCLSGSLALQIHWLIHQHKQSLQSLLIKQFLSGQFFVLLAFIVSFTAMVLSESRAGILAFSVSLILIMSMLTKRVIERQTLLTVIVPVAVLCCALSLYFGQEILQKIASNGLSIGERGEQWQLTWQAIKGSLLFGYGVGSYSTVFQIFREYSDLRQVTFDQSHNDFLHIWLEQGLVGLVAWLALLLVLMRAAIRSLSTTQSSLVVAVLSSCMIVFVAALIQSTVDFNLQISNIRSYFFVIMALVFAAPHVRHDKQG